MFCLFPDPAPTDIYTLSLHDALPISGDRRPAVAAKLANGSLEGTAACRIVHEHVEAGGGRAEEDRRALLDRKSTRLNSSHVSISYAVFCLKKKINDPMRDEIAVTQPP